MTESLSRQQEMCRQTEGLLSAISRLISAASRLKEICEQPEVLENAMRGRVTNLHSAGSRESGSGCNDVLLGGLARAVAWRCE